MCSGEDNIALRDARAVLTTSSESETVKLAREIWESV